MKINKRTLIFGLLLSLVTVFLLNFYIQSLKKDGGSGVKVTYSNVVVAKITIPKSNRILPEMVEVVSIPSEAVHPDALTSLDELQQGITSSDILKAEQVLKSKVATDSNASSLAFKIPEGMRAITVPISEISGLANYLLKGDKVDVLVTYETELEKSITYTQLQDIEILEIGMKTSTSDQITDASPSTISNSVTVLVNPEQAEVIAFATLNGDIHLTLRNPVDSNKVELGYYSFDNLETYLER